MMFTIQARDLRVGDVIDAEDYLRRYAPDTLDAHAARHELFTVEHVARETEDCTVVGMGSDWYGVPAGLRFPLEMSTCVHCGDTIMPRDSDGAWVDENALTSCAPHADHHEREET